MNLSCPWLPEINPLPWTWYLPISFAEGLRDEATELKQPGICVCLGVPLPWRWRPYPCHRVTPFPGGQSQ